MFTLKTLLILSILALGAYTIKSAIQFMLYMTGLRGASLLKKWGDQVNQRKGGHVDISANFAGEENA